MNKINNNLKQISKFCYVIIIIFSCLILCSCETVKPWERGNLSKPIMIFDKNPIETGIKLHHLEYREGSSGGTGSQSGGCGCG